MFSVAIMFSQGKKGDVISQLFSFSSEIRAAFNHTGIKL